MRRIYAFFCALFCAFALFANDVTGFVALEFGGNKTSYLIKNVQHVDINNMPDGKAEMSVLRKDGVSMPNVRTLIFSEEVLFTVQFVNYDGTVLQSSEMSEGEMPTYTGETPTRESTAQYIYTFNGWEPTISPVMDNETYTATYSQQTQKYTIQFVNYDGTVLQSEVLEYGTMPSFKGENPTKSSTAQYAYAFTGWDSEPTVVTGAKVYTAMFASSVNSYTVSFVNDNGDVLQSSQLAYGATPVYNGATPVKEATAEFTYTFAGWSPAITVVEGAQTYTATFSSVKNQYEVVFQNEDGTELQRSNVTYGETPVYAGATPTKPATAEFTYTFAGWSPSITAVTGAQTYTATYTNGTNQYEVIFQNEDGTELQRSNVTYGETPKYNGETPTKAATAEFTYTFAGWSPAITMVEGTQTYTATYSSVKNQYEVIFQNEDGTELQRSNVTYGETPKYNGATPTKPATAEFTYTFAGWSPSITAVTGSQTYTATYSAVKNQYEVVFQNEDGTELQRSNVTYGETPVYAGATPEKEATAEFTYTFAGWSPAITMVEGAQTYTATYSSVKNQYEVIFQNEDGTELQRSNVTYGETPKYNGETPTKDATAEFTYTFAGWSPAITVVEGAQTYTATYSSVKNQYEVIFQNEDGTELQRSNVTYGETPIYSGETPTKATTGEFTYTFAGWSPAITAVEGAQTYTATYSSVKNQYEVIFQNEDGTELQRSNVTYGETPVYAGATPEKAATAEFTYTFAGWSPSITAVTCAQTYTATYTNGTNQYEVIFQNEDGTELQRSNVTYGETPVYAGATPTKPATAEFAYTFAGWSPAITVVEGAQTYTATFKATKRKYTLTAKPQDDAMGTVTGSGTYEYGTKVTVKATKKYGYDFEKWDNGYTEPEITLEIVGDITLIALFTENYCEQTSTPSIPALEVLPVAVWESPLQLEEADAAIKAAIEEKQSEKTAEIKKTWWEVKIENEWEVYTSQIIPNQPTIQVRFALTTVCDKTAVGEVTTITVERPTPENTKACNGAPSVNKYDWLLMLNVNELTAQGYEFNQQNVTWYKVAENDAQDQAVGKGFSYTIDRSLAGTGSYYALIDLPLQTNNVGCKGIYSTPVYDFTGKTQQRAMVVPSIVSPNSEVNVMNLPNEAAEVKVYDQVGKLYYIIQTQGEAKVEFTSQELPGKYIVEIQTATEKYSLKYIVR